MERELEKDLKEIEYLIYVHNERENTHTQSVLERAHEIIETCAKAARTLPDLEELLSRENTPEITRSPRDNDVTEYCPHCDREITVSWNVERDGLEKILEEIEQRKTSAEKLIVKPPHDKLDQVANDTAEAFIEAYKECQEIIRKHMNDSQRKDTFEFDFSGVKSFDCQCGRHYVNTADDRWISVEERLPEKNEYFVDTSSNKEFPNGYYRRLEIAYMTYTVEYIHGYYDGYKWMDKYLDAIKNVVAWRIHEPYRPERRSDEKE